MSSRMAWNFLAGAFGIETHFGGCGQSEKVAMYEAAARIGGETRAEKHQSSARMPLDYRFQRFDDEERADGVVLQRRSRRVAESQSADHDIKRRFQVRQTKISQRNLDFMNRLDMRNASPSLTSKTSRSSSMRTRRRRRVNSPIGVSRKSSSSNHGSSFQSRS